MTTIKLTIKPNPLDDILTALAKAGKPLHATALADASGRAPSTVTHHVWRCVSNYKLIAIRDVRVANRARVGYVLTQKGLDFARDNKLTRRRNLTKAELG